MIKFIKKLYRKTSLWGKVWILGVLLLPTLFFTKWICLVYFGLASGAFTLSLCGAFIYLILYEALEDLQNWWRE